MGHERMRRTREIYERTRWTNLTKHGSWPCLLAVLSGKPVLRPGASPPPRGLTEPHYYTMIDP